MDEKEEALKPSKQCVFSSSRKRFPAKHKNKELNLDYKLQRKN